MSKIEKVEQGICPKCHSENVDYDSIELDGNTAYYPCTCQECGTTWNECYNLDFVGCSEIDTGEETIEFVEG